MRFSQRIKKEPVKKEMQFESMDDHLRAGLWNVFYKEIFYGYSEAYVFENARVYSLFEDIWANFFKYHLDNVPEDADYALEKIKQGFFGLAWTGAYDFAEHVVDNIHLMEFGDDERDHLQKQFNNILEREFSAYRFIDSILSPISNEQEMGVIQEVLEESKSNNLLGVYAHIKAAQSKLSDRENPDFRNSIKESISAVESVVKIISGNPKAALGQALKLIEDKIDIHSALKEGFGKLYGWTNDSDGIRHALMEKSDLDFDDALYMLVSCSAFVHYLIVKAEKAGIDFKNISS